MFNFSDPHVVLTWLLSLIIFLPAVGGVHAVPRSAGDGPGDPAFLAGGHGGRVRADGLAGHSRRQRRR